MPTAVGRPPSRKPRSPPGAIRSDSRCWRRPSPRSTCTSSTGDEGCTSCTGRRGCRIVEPALRSQLNEMIRGQDVGKREGKGERGISRI